MLKIGVIFFSVFSLVLLQGCAPIYKSSYIYHPIKSENKIICSNDCLKNKQTCHIDCLTLQRQCEREANLFSAASDLIYYPVRSTRSEWLADCYKKEETCTLFCENTHKLCHENCGGEVTTQTICVRNCKT